MTDEPLICPSCAITSALDERFCRQCGMPLTYAGVTGVDQPVTAAHERARKVKPQYAEGELLRVAGAANQTEAEFIQGLLLEEGIPSLLRRRAGFDVPDFLAAGPRDVLVPASGYEAAREMLLQADIIAPATSDGGDGGDRASLKLLAGLMAGVALLALVAWLGTDVLA